MFVFRIIILVLACGSAYAFDHSYTEYAKVLGAVVKNGRVDYGALQKDRADLDSWLKDVEAVTESQYVTWSHDQQLAFWINTYNGWFLQIVIDRYPIHGRNPLGISYPQNSVQKIPGIWDNVKINTTGRDVSLNILENRILRTFFHDSRIHFAIVCASLGCPEMRAEPYHADSLEVQLEDATRSFINNPSKVRWDEATKTLSISRIFDWFWEDFAASGVGSWKHLYPKKQAGALAFISRYLPSELRKRLATTKVKITYLNYDWALNDSKVE
jgi:hypothetical protein